MSTCFIFFFDGTGESPFRWDAGLEMSRVLLSEACESYRTWRCLPSGLGTATTECVLWKVCVQGESCADLFAAEGEAPESGINS